MNHAKRNPALDIVRIAATLFVVSEHFFLATGFYEAPIVGAGMYILCVVRESFMVCVPMFLILTGYLMRRKELSGRFYLGIVKTLAIYVLASAICYFAAYKSFAGFWNALTHFSAASYGWYIEMYIGLFFMIPFLNMAYHGNFSDSQAREALRYKRALILTLLVTTAFPLFFNQKIKLFPDWWSRIYPFTYYFIGCYLSEYGLKLRRGLCLLLIGGITVFNGTLAYYSSHQSIFGFWWQSWESLIRVVPAVLVFSLLSTLRLEHLGAPVRKALKIVSDLCLGVYLVSEIFDNQLYSILNQAVGTVLERAYYFPIMVVSVFACSLALSAALSGIYTLLHWAAVKLAGKKSPIPKTN